MIFFQLTAEIDCNSFDCADHGINEFIQSEAIDYQSHNLGRSYGFKTQDGLVVAYFTIFNDCIRDLGDTKKAMEKFGKAMGVPHAKRLKMKSYPAIKIGRLGLHKDYHGTPISKQFMDFIKAWTVRDHKPAVKFLILDSYNNPKNLRYYAKNGFELLPIPPNADPDFIPETIPMYFHLDIITG